MHVQRSDLRAVPSVRDDGLLSIFAAERAAAARETSALAPVRGALLGSVLGAVCWVGLATLVWLALAG
jgi:hypothetical protein